MFLAKYYESGHVNHTALMRTAYILVGKSYDNIQHKVPDTDGNTILKLIQHIQDERLGTGSMWLDPEAGCTERKNLRPTQTAGTEWITDRVSEYGVPWNQFLGHDLQLLLSGETQSDTARITPRKPATALEIANCSTSGR